jgi:rubredoxin
MTLYFDGGLVWICPHCGAENLRIEKVEVVVEAGFSIDGNEIELNGVDWEDVKEEFRCPECHKPVNAKDIRGGFEKWLERLRQSSPEEYATVVADLLEP